MASHSDRERALTPEGRVRIEARAQILMEAREAIQNIYHSPFVRTTQTAEIVGGIANVRLTAWPSLEPSGRVDRVLADLLEANLPAMLVSHLPLVDDLCERLIGRRIGFSPGTVVKIQAKDLLASNNLVQSIYRD